MTSEKAMLVRRFFVVKKVVISKALPIRDKLATVEMIKYSSIFNSKDIWSLSFYARRLLVELSMLMFYTKSEAIFFFYLSLSH